MPLLGRPVSRPRKGPIDLPAEVRFILGLEKYSSMEVLILEDPPQVRSILYKKGRSSSYSSEARRYDLCKPWSYLLVNCNSGREGSQSADASFWFARQRINFLDDPFLVAAPMPNITYTQLDGSPHISCCLGYDPASGKTIVDVAEVFHRRFWASIFNDEYPFVDSFIPDGIRGKSWGDILEKWEALGKEPEWKEVSIHGKAVDTLASAIDFWRGPCFFKTVGDP